MVVTHDSYHKWSSFCLLPESVWSYKHGDGVVYYSVEYTTRFCYFILSNKYKNIYVILSIRFFILLPINNFQIQIEISVWCRLGTLWHAIIWFFCYLIRTQMMGVVYSLKRVLNLGRREKQRTINWWLISLWSLYKTKGLFVFVHA